MNEEFKVLVLGLLKNYLGDLEYQASNGFEAINLYSNGTPYFEGEQEMHDYLFVVETVIAKIKGELCEN